MAANPKTLRIVETRAAGPHTRVIDIACDAVPFEAIGGKYIIVNTGVVAGEKPVKRAYSLVPVEGAPQLARLTVKRLGDGPGSNAMHAAGVGAELPFSGPWGKLVPEGGTPAKTLVVATDTGITSALGIAARKEKPAEILWLRAADEDFISEEEARARVEREGIRFVSTIIPPVKSAERAAAAFAHIDARAAEVGPSLVIAAGDGALVHPLIERLRAAEVRIECYFHNPEKKSAS